MTGWGDRTISSWGAFTWGDFLFLNGQRMFGDVLAEKSDVQVSLDADALAQATEQSEMDCDLVAQAFGVQARCEADMFVARLPTDQLSQQHIQPVVLIEIQLRDGTLRVASRDLTAAGFGWAGLLVNAPSVERAFGERVDDLRITLADDGISSRFSEASPPEGVQVEVYALALTDTRESLISIFSGRVEEVTAAGQGQVSLEVVRFDSVIDRVLGSPVSTAAHPRAAPQAIGKMFPIVFGSAEVEGLVTSYNRITTLTAAVDEAATAIRVRDTDVLPGAGKGVIDDEIVQWTDASNGVLTGVTRAVDGTFAAAHPSGTVLSIKDTFVVHFAGHQVTSINQVRLMDAGGTLVVPEPEGTIYPVSGRVEWDRTPTIEAPSRSVETILAGFDSAGGGNTASDPLRAARESNEYTDLNFARLTPPTQRTLSLFRSARLEELGEITRAGLVVVFDPAAPGATVQAGQPLGTLVNSDTTPAWAVRRVERQYKASYDISDPTHSHPVQVRTVIVRPRTVLNFPAETDPANPLAQWFYPARAINGDTANWAFTQAGIDAPLIANDADLLIGSNESIVRGYFRAWGGGQPVGGVARAGEMKVGFNPQGPYGPSLFVTPLQVTLPRTSQPVRRDSPWVSGDQFPSPSSFPNVSWVAQPVDPVVDVFGNPTGERFMVRNMELVLEVGEVIQPALSNTAQRRSVANFFDVTQQAQGDWGFFSSTSLRISNDTGIEVRVNACYWAIEYRPTIRTAIEVPRAFATVRGKSPNGEPTETLREILTGASPNGLALDPGVITQGSYARARQSLAADAIRLDFAVTQRVSGIALAARVAEQADLRQWWEAGQHYLSRKPDPQNLGAAFRVYRDDDVIRETLGRSRSRIDQVVNRVEARYAYSPHAQDLSALVTKTDAPSQALFGELTTVIDLDLVQSGATADRLAELILERAKLPRWLVSFRLPLFGLELRRGDLLQLVHDQFSFGRAEVLRLPMSLTDFSTVEVTCVVWEE